MQRRFISLLTATLLFATTIAPAATAQYGGSPNYAAEWQDLVAHLEDGNVSDAQQIYNQAFQGPAQEAPQARSNVEGGFSAAQGNATDTVDYAVASQQIEKSLLAVAAANVDAAVADGDVEEAQAWFDLLHAKFGEELSASKAAFGNATSDNLDDVQETFHEEYRSLIVTEAYHETEEVPGLIAGGDTAEAAKEAAEGRYYYESVRVHVRATLGNQTGDTLTHELDELIEKAKAGNQEEAEDEAGEILDLLAHYALATAEDEKAEAYHDVKEHLEAEEVDAAEAAYDEAFAEEGGEYASAADQRIRQAFDDARTALENGDEIEYEVQVQIIAKGILDVGTRVAFAELQEREIHEALEYIAPVVAKFGWAKEPSEGALHIGHAAANGDLDDERFRKIKAGVSGKFLEKVRAETDEVFINWNDTATAREKAIEGVAYYQPARSYVVDILGEDPDTHLNEELEALFNATTARDRAAAEEAADEVRTLLDQVEAGGQDVTELDSIINDLRGKIDFVAEEYHGYQEAKAAGDEDEAQVELGEAKAFTNASKQRIKDNEATLRDADSQAVDQLLANLDEISAILDETGDVDRVDTLVDESLDLLEQLKAGNIEGTVTLRFGQVQDIEDRTGVVPVTLEGVPEDGFAVQATITYNSSIVEVVSVDIPTQVGSSTTSEGEIRFNAAATEAPDGNATVAEIRFRLVDTEAESLTLDVEIEELADAQGEPLGLKGVEGDTIDIASIADASTLPGFPAIGALAALVLTGLAARTWRGRDE